MKSLAHASDRRDHPSEAPMSRARRQLLDRLCEVVAWPATRIPVHERDLAADLLIGILPSSELPARIRLSQRLALLSEAPKALQRYLCQDHLDVAAPLLTHGLGMDDADLVDALRPDRIGHALAVASRRRLAPLVCEALVRLGEVVVTKAVLANPTATLSMAALDVALSQSRSDADMPLLLAARAELRPSQALAMFWWATGSARVAILRRFAVDRAVLIGELGDVFLTAAAERWGDAEARQALLLIERRQRTRTDSRGEKAQLEVPIARLAQNGFDPVWIAEVAHQTSLRAVTAVKIFKDAGGEALAVFAKASSLKRAQLEALWQGLHPNDAFTPEAQAKKERLLMVFDTLSIAKAQGVLRVWNWGVGAAAEPATPTPRPVVFS
jgi:uncharacterized protein (DUF2336 family)